MFRKLEPSTVKVRCGEWNVKDENEKKTHQDRFAESITIHPRYSGIRRVENDIALLHLKEDFVLDSNLGKNKTLSQECPNYASLNRYHLLA